MVGHADIKTKVEDRVPDWPEDAEDIKREAGTIAEDPYRVLKLFKGTQLNTKEDLKHTWAQSPSDYLPGEPDLPGAKKSLKGTKIPNDKDGATYWTYACVLIALVKADPNYTNTMRIAGLKKAPASLDTAVQALHDHYMGPQVKTQYDDSSARLGVMRDWGWSRVYSGNTQWEELATRTSLAPGTYIFDIKGHTVLVRVKKEVKRGEPIVGELSATYEPESDAGNFKVGRSSTSRSPRSTRGTSGDRARRRARPAGRLRYARLKCSSASSVWNTPSVPRPALSAAMASACSCVLASSLFNFLNAFSSSSSGVRCSTTSGSVSLSASAAAARSSTSAVSVPSDSSPRSCEGSVRHVASSRLGRAVAL